MCCVGSRHLRCNYKRYVKNVNDTHHIFEYPTVNHNSGLPCHVRRLGTMCTVYARMVCFFFFLFINMNVTICLYVLNWTIWCFWNRLSHSHPHSLIHLLTRCLLNLCWTVLPDSFSFLIKLKHWLTWLIWAHWTELRFLYIHIHIHIYDYNYKGGVHVRA